MTRRGRNPHEADRELGSISREMIEMMVAANPAMSITIANGIVVALIEMVRARLFAVNAAGVGNA